MPSRRGLAHFGDDYPFRLEVTPQARREIGHAIARENRHELRPPFGRGDIPATLQRVDTRSTASATASRETPRPPTRAFTRSDRARTMSPRRTVDIGWNKPTGARHFNGKGAQGPQGPQGPQGARDVVAVRTLRTPRTLSTLSPAYRGSYQSAP